MLQFKHIELTREDGVARAKKFNNQGIYGLGGGANATASSTPFDANGKCDCSNFTDFSCGFNKYQVFDGQEYWFNTDGLIDDATGPQRLMEVVPATVSALPGDIIVYHSTWVNGERIPGHVAMLLTAIHPEDRHSFKWVHGGSTYNTFDASKVMCIHCAPRSSKYPYAVRTTTAQFCSQWRTRGYILRYKWWALPQPVANAAVAVTPPVAAQTAAPTEPMIMKLAKIFELPPKKPRTPGPFWPWQLPPDSKRYGDMRVYA